MQEDPANSETDSDAGEVPDNENRVVRAMRELGIDRKTSERATQMLNTLRGHRKQQRMPDWDPKTRTLEGFFEFAAPLVRDAQAQLFQDLWVLYELGAKRRGYFVEFGATNGITTSNTHLLEKRFRWKGIVAEPNPFYHRRIKRERRCKISHKCLYSRSGERMQFMCTEKAVFSRLEAVNPHDFHEESKRADYKMVEVETISLNDLLDAYRAPKVIDYISVDTEGSELEILQAFDFDRRLVRLFTIEHNFTPMRAEIYDLMTSHGYLRRFPEYSRFDDWYVLDSMVR